MEATTTETPDGVLDEEAIMHSMSDVMVGQIINRVAHSLEYTTPYTILHHETETPCNTTLLDDEDDYIKEGKPNRMALDDYHQYHSIPGYDGITQRIGQQSSSTDLLTHEDTMKERAIRPKHERSNHNSAAIRHHRPLHLMHSRELGDTASNGDTRGYKDTFASTKMLTIARIRAYRQREASNPPPGFDDGFESSCNRPDPTTERRLAAVRKANQYISRGIHRELAMKRRHATKQEKQEETCNEVKIQYMSPAEIANNNRYVNLARTKIATLSRLTKSILDNNGNSDSEDNSTYK